MAAGSATGAGWKQNAEISSVRSATHSLYARLRSIEYDARRVWELREEVAPNLPLFGNVRAGAWYVPPPLAQKCCFKSADGHYGQWNVSTRRPNMRLLREAARAGGAVVVDVTRAGKAWPDALAKTVPLWCAVISALSLGVKPEDGESLQSLLSLHSSVSPSEAAAIRRLLPRMLQTWLDAHVDIASLVPELGSQPEAPAKVRPLWIRADAEVFWEDGIPSASRLGFLPIVCVSASPPLKPGLRAFVEADPLCMEDTAILRPCPDLRRTRAFFSCHSVGFAYVQGAGDDEEAWCHGLTPEIFWDNRARIFAFASTRQNVSSSDGDFRSEVRAFLKEISCSCSSRSPCSNPSNGQDVDHLVFCSGLRVIVSSDVSIEADAVAAQNLGGCVGVLALSHSRCRWLRIPSVESDEFSSDTPVDNRIQWLDMANFRGKPDYKNGLCRSLRKGLLFISKTLLPETQSSVDGVTGRHVTVLCDCGNGEWAAGVAVAWLASACGTDFALTPRELKDMGGAPSVTKSRLRAVTLQLLLERDDLTVSRETAQQLNRYFLSPAPP